MQKKSNNGVLVDMDSLRIQNENVVAVGNMNVNAKGDKLGPGGEIIETAAERVHRYHSEHQTETATASIKPNLDEEDEHEEVVQSKKVTKEKRKKEIIDDEGNITITEDSNKDI
ncbi:hypothetical protein EST35_0289 [Pseudomonas phage vB_PaeM_PA5oct]|uniref:Uncharacterized protein n=1 Tax=Pseudomonas phage vB_PaeM_PA5oct TaxID=2163605 RepID=A0A4Y5JUR1_9CAUD|nr:hypothetical protein PQE65_gp195 [Pseudomonas phage vB_PaeM_PA5oct]QCG76170.1 hypothetical protein EST35_0289 [Pseudomonas phage vB_PaeM_PA5oct]BDR25757.1 hypothetical protein RVBP16_1970 [Pseudomonas phage sp. 30-2]